MKKYIALKERIKGHVSKVVIENFNNEFSVGLYVPCSITYIDKSKEYKQIEYSNCGIKKYVNSLYDCNLIGNIEIDNKGAFIRTYELYGKKVKERIYRRSKG